ncbi:MAG: 50S ribosomal protein L17 [Verrucomicrobiota bacterium]
MRHAKHKHTLGVTAPHRAAMLSNLAVALFTHNRIKTTLAKARALRPFAEKVITLAKKAKNTEGGDALHYKRVALTKVRDEATIELLFNEKVEEFLNRAGGYTRIYKLVKRKGDGADLAIIELVNADDSGYSKPKKKAAAAKAEDTEEVIEAETEEVEETPEPVAESEETETPTEEEAPKA